MDSNISVKSVSLPLIGILAHKESPDKVRDPTFPKGFKLKIIYFSF